MSQFELIHGFQLFTGLARARKPIQPKFALQTGCQNAAVHLDADARPDERRDGSSRAPSR